MRTLQIEEKTARKLYKDASPEFKATLEDSFGKEFFNGKITDRIKTYADACAELGESPMDDDELKEMGFTDDEINYRKIKTITKALNEDKVIDWNNPNQKKWVPWFDLSSSGFVFRDAAYRCTAATAGYGSRLCFASEELATYAGKHFIDIWNDILSK